VAVREVAKGDEPDRRDPVSAARRSPNCCSPGAGWGAHEDIIPDEAPTSRTPVRSPTPTSCARRLAALLEAGGTSTPRSFDPYVPRSMPVACRISDDLADVVIDLDARFWRNYREGRGQRGPCGWWQFSCLSNLGPDRQREPAGPLQSLVAHVRLDSPLGRARRGSTPASRPRPVDERLAEEGRVG